MRQYLLSAAALSMLALGGCGQTNQAEVETIVKDYILENPEILVEAMGNLEQKERAKQVQEAETYLAENAALITGDPRDIKIGPEDAKVTIVEFFDYNCGYCKATSEWAANVIKEHGDDVRVIFKEIPLLDGPKRHSRLAAKSALAAARQGKYATVHFSLMAERQLSPERIEKIVELSGVDMKKFKEDMKDEALEKQLNDGMKLVRTIPNFGGTPYFIINGKTVAGANIPKITELLNAELEG